MHALMEYVLAVAHTWAHPACCCTRECTQVCICVMCVLHAHTHITPPPLSPSKRPIPSPHGCSATRVAHPTTGAARPCSFSSSCPAAALFGLGAALGVFYWRHKGLLGERSDYVLKQLGFTLAVNMAYSLANRRVDNWWAWGGRGDQSQRPCEGRGRPALIFRAAGDVRGMLQNAYCMHTAHSSNAAVLHRSQVLTKQTKELRAPDPDQGRHPPLSLCGLSHPTSPRGHLGGMAGGAAVAWLLGPRFVRDSTTGRVQDQPPWPLLAHSQQPGGVVGATIRGLLVAGQPGEGEGGKGRKGKGGKGRDKKLQEQAQEAAREGAGDEQQ